MRTSRSIEVDRSRDEVVEILARDETLLSLLPGETELVESRGSGAPRAPAIELWAATAPRPSTSSTGRTEACASRRSATERCGVS